MTAEHPDFKLLEGFCEHNINTLIQITITDRKSKGFGKVYPRI